MSTNQADKSVLRQILRHQAPFILYAAAIYVVSSISRLPTPDIGLTFADKLIHALEYGIFCYLALRAFRNPPLAFSFTTTCLLAASVTILYAALDEYHQSFVPGRNADAYDLLADIFGVIFALLVYNVVRKRPDMSR